MAQLTASKAQELTTIAAELPPEKVEELLDFAYYLRQRYTTQPKHGSATNLLQVIQEVGPLEFVEGELEELLADIEAMRLLDMDDHE